MREALLEFEKRCFEIAIAERRDGHGHAHTARKDEKRVRDAQFTKSQQISTSQKCKAEDGRGSKEGRFQCNAGGGDSHGS
jgi:hypothetical protein